MSLSLRSIRKSFLALTVLVLAIVGVLAALPLFAQRVDGAKSVQSDACAGPVIDVDGNAYRTVQIGELCWFGSNLKSLHYQDGTPIKSYAFIDVQKHGLLYRFEHIDSRSGLCPLSWRVPSDEDFKTLEKAIGMNDTEIDREGWRGKGNVSRALKAFDTSFAWTGDERKRVNNSGFGFTASGAEFQGRVSGEGRFGDLWTSTESDVDHAMYRSVFWISITSPIRGDVEKIRRATVSKEWGFSVRCVQNLEV